MKANRQTATHIPFGAAWNSDKNVWELCERNIDGQRQGKCRLLRADGTLLEVGSYDADERTGPFVAYHPNGQLAREGMYRAGQVHGTVVAYASDASTTEPLRACCVPATAWTLRALYTDGELLREVFHDRDDRPLLESGDLRPDPPLGVPAHAALDEPQGRWVAGDTDAEGNRVGLHRSWTLDGRLIDENEYREGRLTFSRTYGTEGAQDSQDSQGRDAQPPRIVRECHFIGDSQPHGAYRRRFPPEENPYSDLRIREELGSFDRGRRVGSWSFLDDAGEVVATHDLGRALDEDDAAESPAFAAGGAGPESPSAWWHLAARLRTEGRVREALCAAARGAARRGDAAGLAAFMAQNTLALAPGVRQQRGHEIAASSTETLTSALEALVTGADAAAVFCTLASLLDSAQPAALDFADASLLLAPAHRMTHLTRALIRIEQGDDRGALADAAEIALESRDAAASLREHVRIAFPDFSDGATSFWPARQNLDDATTESGPQVPAQSLPAIRHMIQVYATRLERLRVAVRERVAPRAPDPDPGWIPPDTSALLPQGPVELRHVTIPAPADADEEETEIQINEDLLVDTREGRSVADLLTVARANWSALCWLCWACGLDRVVLPDVLAPPPPDILGTAVAMSVAGCFRAYDRVITGGVRGLAQGLPGFVWEGIDIDEMPNHFARIAAAEYLETRSMFLWLILPDAVSPFQSDLREA